MLQYANGRDMVNLNRDNAAGFRLDILTTYSHLHPQYLQHAQITWTSIHRYTCYNFSSTGITPELHQNNPGQHAADLEILEEKQELFIVFINASTGLRNSITG